MGQGRSTVNKKVWHTLQSSRPNTGDPRKYDMENPSRHPNTRHPARVMCHGGMLGPSMDSDAGFPWPAREEDGLMSLVNIQGRYKHNTNIITCRPFTRNVFVPMVAVGLFN